MKLKNFHYLHPPFKTGSFIALEANFIYLSIAILFLLKSPFDNWPTKLIKHEQIKYCNEFFNVSPTFWAEQMSLKKMKTVFAEVVA